MKIYLLLKYYLNLNTKKLSAGPKAISANLTRSLIKEDLERRLHELIKTYLNLQDGYAYRVEINKLSNRLWHAQIRAKSNNENSSRIDLIYKLKNKSLHLTVIK